MPARTTTLSLIAAVLLAMTPHIPAARAAGERIFDGAWLYTRDSGDGSATAFEISGSSMIYLSGEGELIALARGWWTVDPYANPDGRGVYHVKTEITETAIIDGPAYEPETMNIEVTMTGPDRGEIRAAGDSVRRGVIQRIACVPAVHYVDRSDPPPEGCEWHEVRGLGFDGLTGDCRWDEDWAENWESISRDPDGQPWPAACLLAEPVAFPD